MRRNPHLPLGVNTRRSAASYVAMWVHPASLATRTARKQERFYGMASELGPTSVDVAVIGAGVAGLACARAATEAGLAAVAFDKGRGPGGRLSTRRVATPVGEISFDHGAQYFTARGEAFLAHVEAMRRTGAVDLWGGVLMEEVGAERLVPLKTEPRFVGAPAMSSFVRAASEGLDVRFGAQVERIAPDPRGWSLVSGSGEVFAVARAVVCATPAEQAAVLLAEASPALAEEAAGAVSAPCWAAMAAFDAPAPTAFDGVRFATGILGWAARNTSKPGRAGAEAWVLHASPAWSTANLGLEPDDAARRLVAAFRRKVRGCPAPVFSQAHRWRYALVETAVGAAYNWDPVARIGACGDWRLGPRVECAWESGHRLGQAVAEALT